MKIKNFFWIIFFHKKKKKKTHLLIWNCQHYWSASQCWRFFPCPTTGRSYGGSWMHSIAWWNPSWRRQSWLLPTIRCHGCIDSQHSWKRSCHRLNHSWKWGWIPGFHHSWSTTGFHHSWSATWWRQFSSSLPWMLPGWFDCHTACVACCETSSVLSCSWSRKSCSFFGAFLLRDTKPLWRSCCTCIWCIWSESKIKIKINWIKQKKK